MREPYDTPPICECGVCGCGGECVRADDAAQEAQRQPVPVVSPRLLSPEDIQAGYEAMMTGPAPWRVRPGTYYDR